jgi:competence protein ComEC
MEKIKLLDNKKEWLILLLASFIIISLQIAYKYYFFLEFKSTPIYKTQAHIINNYKKIKPHKSYYILKLEDESQGIIFYTTVDDDKLIDHTQNSIKIWIITKHITFLDYLRGFYAPNIYYETNYISSFKDDISIQIKKSHTDSRVAQIFDAIFLAIPTSKELRETFSLLSISHLIAISGFHLGVISMIIFGIFYLPYSYFQSRYFPYRHRKNDLLFVTDMFLLAYLFLIGDVASVIRAYAMFSLGYAYYKNHIKIISFENLAITFILVLTFFPTFIFSYSFWFSILGVFYIFLFLHYFKSLGVIASFLLLNFWVFFAFNPIIHYFFGATSLVQLISPFLTMVFSIFYPLEIFLHLINQGDLLDCMIVSLIDYRPVSYEVFTPLWYFMLYILASFVAIFKRWAFVIVNAMIVWFSLYLYL